MTSPDFIASLTALRALAATHPARVNADLAGVAKAADRPEQLMALAGFVATLDQAETKMPVRRLAIAGEVTVNGIAAAATVALAGEGILAASYVAPYGAYRQDILDPNSGLYAARPDIVLLVPLPELPIASLGQATANRMAEDCVANFRNLWTQLADRLPGVHIVQHLFEAPDQDFLGPAEMGALWSALRVTQRVNDGLATLAPPYVHLIDMDRLAGRVGRKNWREPRLWFHGQVPFSLKHLGDYKSALAAAFRRALGKTAKALIVDLDNTLWRGVIGDDGPDGILLGPETPVGAAHLAFCEYVRALGQRGVILGICSKNDPALALKVFDDNPHMPLKREDFAVIKCNWDDKATNLREAAAELNIDLSAVVFIDDNEVECELVRRELPSVTVVALTGDPAGFCRQIDTLRLFEADSFSAEDLKRQASYKGRQQAAAARTQARDLDAFLASLEMKGSLTEAREEDLPRLAQMEVKTNQFNLTTRRWSADQLRKFIGDPDYDVLCFRLADRFADHGLVSSAVIHHAGGEARIESWLMSCRVFSRTAEEFILNGILAKAAAQGATSIVGMYDETERNGVVAGLYPRLGFVAASGVLRLPLAQAAMARTFIADVAKDDMPLDESRAAGAHWDASVL